MNDGAPVSVKIIEEARIAVFLNAVDLLDDAELLYANGRFTRAYALAHLACEELAKLTILVRVGVELARGRVVDWKKFYRRFRNHKEKLRNIVLFDYFFLYEDDPVNDTDARRAKQELERIWEVDRTKNLSLYVDVLGGKVSNPSSAVTREDADKMIRLANARIEFCRPVEENSAGSLEEIANSPTFTEAQSLVDSISRGRKIE